MVIWDVSPIPSLRPKSDSGTVKVVLWSQLYGRAGPSLQICLIKRDTYKGSRRIRGVIRAKPTVVLSRCFIVALVQRLSASLCGPKETSCKFIPADKFADAQREIGSAQEQPKRLPTEE